MSIYNPLLKFLREEGKIIREGKGIKAIKESETVKTFAKPAALGAGVGVGGYAAMRGVSEGIRSMGASTAKDAAQKFTGLLMFAAIVLILIYIAKNLRR
ncbi:MAG: hypothetical protein H0Z28_04525 [Archaeoglobus sp.]|nr:hypothetical protein [Archaeoglobus sp.]